MQISYGRPSTRPIRISSRGRFDRGAWPRGTTGRSARVRIASNSFRCARPSDSACAVKQQYSGCEAARRSVSSTNSSPVIRPWHSSSVGSVTGSCATGYSRPSNVGRKGSRPRASLVRQFSLTGLQIGLTGCRLRLAGFEGSALLVEVLTFALQLLHARVQFSLANFGCLGEGAGLLDRFFQLPFARL